ncbi:MAG TPA: carboxypeptidase-like regulatory domain-containing protein [Jatrophihabitans sp.]|nr:carboxypeptidase-like regulatory domain-containing protein [Jatrophihabitans sp.]
MAILAGCSSGGSDSNGGSGEDAGLATLTVHIGLFGGPAKPGGGMALSNSPVANENVTAVNAAGRQVTAQTDADGVATMTLRPGRYTVFSTYCRVGTHHAVLAANKAAHVQIDCPVP